MSQERYYEYMLRRFREENEKMNKALENAKRSIWVTFRKEGIHLYPAAKDDRLP